MRDRVVLMGLLAMIVMVTGCTGSQQATLPPPPPPPSIAPVVHVLYAGNGHCCLKIFSLPVTASSAASISVFLPGGLATLADSVALDNANHVFVLDDGPGPPIVQEYNRPITSASTPFATITLTGSTDCTFIATDTSGNLWVSCLVPAEVYVINGPFTTAGPYSKSPDATLSTTGLAGPHDIAFNAAGNLFVESGGGIFVWTSLTNGSAKSGSLNMAGGGLGLAFDAAGNLYAADSTNGSLVRWNAPVPTTGTAVSPDIVDPVANTGFTPFGVTGVTVDASGNLYVGESGLATDIRVFNSTTFSATSTPSVVDTASDAIFDIDAGNQ